MKVSFSRAVPYTPEFNKNRDLPEKDRIRTKLRVLNLAELAFVGEVIAKLGLDKEGVDLGKVGSEVLKDFAKDMQVLLGGHVEMEGLEDESGPVKVEELPVLVPYLPLSLELIVELAHISAPGEADRKNSNAPSV